MSSKSSSINRGLLSLILPESKLKELIRSWLTEDCPNFDCAAYVLGDKIGKARILCKSCCVLAGVPFFNAIFNELECKVEWSFVEGTAFPPSENLILPTQVATVTGPIKSILIGERLALNVISRASGVASLCRRFVKKAETAGWKGRIAGTRKTTPGFRMVEKYALLVGGADSHRNDLSSMVMLKDNHIWSTGSISEAVRNVLEVAGFALKVEVECQNLEEGLEAAEAGAHVVMFDNHCPQALHCAAAALKSKYPNVIVESSGGITEENIMQYFNENVDIISTSKLVQGYPCADFSLKILKTPPA